MNDTPGSLQITGNPNTIEERASAPQTSSPERNPDISLEQKAFESALHEVLSLRKPFRPDLNSSEVQTVQAALQKYGIFPNAFRFISPLLSRKYFSTADIADENATVLSTEGLNELLQNKVKEFSEAELSSMIGEISKKLMAMEGKREKENAYHKALHNLEVLHRDLLILLAHHDMEAAKKLLSTLDNNENTVEELLPVFPGILRALEKADVPSGQIAERIVSSGFHDYDHAGRTLRIAPQRIAVNGNSVVLSSDKRSAVLRGEIEREGEKIIVTIQGKRLMLDSKIAAIDGDTVTVPIDGEVFKMRTGDNLEINSPYNQTPFSNEEVAAAHAIKFASEKGFTLPQLLRINQRIINTTFGAAPRITPYEGEQTVAKSEENTEIQKIIDEDGWELSFGADMGAFATASLEKYLERGCKQIVKELPLRRQQNHTSQRPPDVLFWVRSEYGFFNFFIKKDTVTKKLPVIEELFGERLDQKIAFLEKLRNDLTAQGEKAMPAKNTPEYEIFVEGLLNEHQAANDGKTLPGKDTTEYQKLVTERLNIYIARHAEDDVPQEDGAFAAYIDALKNSSEDREYNRCKALVLEYLRPLVTREY